MLLALAALFFIEPEPTPATSARVADWGMCVHNHAFALPAASHSPEAAADAGLLACEAEEREVERQLVADLGSDAAHQMPDLRRHLRTIATQAVSDVRSGAQRPPTAVGLWGECVGERSAALIDSDISSAEIAERALSLCATEEAAALREMIADSSPAEAEAEMAAFRAGITAMVEQNRAARRRGN